MLKELPVCELLLSYQNLTPSKRKFYTWRLDLVIHGGSWSSDKGCVSAVRQSATAWIYNLSQSVVNDNYLFN